MGCLAAGLIRPPGIDAARRWSPFTAAPPLSQPRPLDLLTNGFKTMAHPLDGLQTSATLAQEATIYHRATKSRVSNSLAGGWDGMAIHRMVAQVMATIPLAVGDGVPPLV